MISSIKKMVFFVTLGGFLTSPLYAKDHINCAVRFSGAPAPTMVCANQDDKFPIQITHRKMPGWFTNASLKIVEVCEMEARENEDKDKIIVQQKINGKKDTLQLENGQIHYENNNEDTLSDEVEKEPKVASDEDIPLKALKCHRRFCSQDHSDLKVSINGAPIPAGYVLLKLWVSTRHSEIEVRCEDIEEENEENEK